MLPFPNRVGLRGCLSPLPTRIDGELWRASVSHGQGHANGQGAQSLTPAAEKLIACPPPPQRSRGRASRRGAPGAASGAATAPARGVTAAPSASCSLRITVLPRSACPQEECKAQ